MDYFAFAGPRTLVVTMLLGCRITISFLCGASLVCLDLAPRTNHYSTFNAARLVHDAAVALFHAPVMPGRCASWAIIVVESVLSCLTYAASARSIAVLVFFERDTRACALMEPGVCGSYKMLVVLAATASIFTTTIALMLAYLRFSPHWHAVQG
ncbi:hypothetical protein ACP4OV_026156 [Aristida adscensionis]